MAYQRWFKTVRDQQGNAINGASCTVYEVGTSTVATIYDPNSDDTSPSPLSNPFVTTSNGRFGFAADDGEYDVVIQGGSLATQSFRVALSSCGIYLAPYTGAVATTQSEKNSRYIDVFDFMSSAQKTDILAFTGAVRCDVEINRAIAAAVLEKCGEVRFPAGKYRIEEALTTGLSEHPIKLKGDGNYYTTKGTAFAWHGGNNTSAIKLPGYGSIEDIFLYNGNAATVVVGIDMVGPSAVDNRANCHLTNVTSQGFAVGFAFDFAWNCDLRFCWALHNTIGYDIRTEANALTFTGCVANSNDTGVTHNNGSGARGVLWSGGAIQGSAIVGIDLSSVNVSSAWVFDAVYFEANYRTAILGGHVELNRPFINGDGGSGARPPIQIAWSRGVSVVDAYPDNSVTNLFECTGADGVYVGNSIYVTSNYSRASVQKSVYDNTNILGLGWLDPECYQTIETEWINANAAYLKPISYPLQAFNLRERKLIRCTMMVMTQIQVIAPDFTVGVGRSAGYVDAATRAFVANVPVGVYDIPIVGGAPLTWYSNVYSYWASGTAETSGMYKLIFTFI